MMAFRGISSLPPALLLSLVVRRRTVEARMSFGITLYREPDAGAAERKAFWAAMKRWGWDGQAGSPYQIGTPTGVTVELYGSTLWGRGKFTGGSLEVRGFDTELCRLVLDLARAGRFEISSDADPMAIIVTDGGQQTTLFEGCRLMVCRIAEELEAALCGGFEAWQAYRDQACGQSGERNPAEPSAAPDRGGTNRKRGSRSPRRRGR